MGICSSIPRVTLRSARIVAEHSGFKKEIDTRFYANHSASIIYAGKIPNIMIANLKGALFQTEDIIHIHIVKGNGDSLIETLRTVYVVSAAVNITDTSYYMLESHSSLEIPLMTI